MPLAPALVSVMVCPKSKEKLIYFAQEGFLLSPGARLRYRIDDGVPVLLVEEATEVAASDVERWMKQAKELGLTGA